MGRNPASRPAGARSEAGVGARRRRGAGPRIRKLLFREIRCAEWTRVGASAIDVSCLMWVSESASGDVLAPADLSESHVRRARRRPSKSTSSLGFSSKDGGKGADSSYTPQSPMTCPPLALSGRRCPDAMQCANAATCTPLPPSSSPASLQTSSCSRPDALSPPPRLRSLCLRPAHPSALVLAKLRNPRSSLRTPAIAIGSLTHPPAKQALVHNVITRFASATLI